MNPVLENWSDLTGELGISYHKVQSPYLEKFIFDQVSLFFSRCHSMIKILMDKKEIKADIFSISIIKPHQRFSVEVESLTADWVILLPQPKLVTKVICQYQLTDQISEVLSYNQTLPRENWLNEIMHRYVYERGVAGQKNNEATRFLETEIVKEILFLSQNQDIKSKNKINLSPDNMEQKSGLIQKAIIYIEDRLAQPLTINMLSKNLGCSPSTLRRTFLNELNRAPMEYIRQRRLEEAILLLKQGKNNVSEVASLIGYESVSAFVAAFKDKYGYTPSKLLEIA